LFLSAVTTAVVLVSIAVVTTVAQAGAGPGTTRGNATAPQAHAVATIYVEPTPSDESTQAGAESDPTATPAYQVSSDQAIDVALKAAPGTALTGTPELVEFQGTPAYEVILTAGKVYVDAHTGAVLFNGALAAAKVNGPIDQEQAIQIAVAYMQANNGSTQVVQVRMGRLRQLQGMQTFEVTFASGVRVYVNAQTGEIALVSQPQGSN